MKKKTPIKSRQLANKVNKAKQLITLLNFSKTASYDLKNQPK